MRQLAVLAGWVCLVAIAVASLVPGDDRPTLGLAGHYEHLLAYGTAAFAFSLVTIDLARQVRLVLLLTGLAGLLETLQGLVPGRHPGFLEIGAAAIGAVLGLAVGRVSARALTRGWPDVLTKR